MNTIEELFEEYAEVKLNFIDCDCQTKESEIACDNCKCESERMKQIIKEITTKIEENVLREVMELANGIYAKESITIYAIKSLAESKSIKL